MKRLFLLLALLSGCILVQAQKIHFGPRLGLNFSNITINGFTDQGRTRVHAGLFAAKPLADKWEAQAELLYSLQGNRQNGQTVGTNSVNYLLIPLLAKYKPLDALSVYVGPQVGVALLNKFKSEKTGIVYKIEDVLSPVDISLLFGAEYEVYDGLTAGARYFFSLGDAHQDEDKVAKNQVFQLSIAYDLFGLLFEE